MLRCRAGAAGQRGELVVGDEHVDPGPHGAALAGEFLRERHLRQVRQRLRAALGGGAVVPDGSYGGDGLQGGLERLSVVDGELAADEVHVVQPVDLEVFPVGRFDVAAVVGVGVGVRRPAAQHGAQVIGRHQARLLHEERLVHLRLRVGQHLPPLLGRRPEVRQDLGVLDGDLAGCRRGCGQRQVVTQGPAEADLGAGGVDAEVVAVGDPVPERAGAVEGPPPVGLHDRQHPRRGGRDPAGRRRGPPRDAAACGPSSVSRSTPASTSATASSAASAAATSGARNAASSALASSGAAGGMSTPIVGHLSRASANSFCVRF